MSSIYEEKQEGHILVFPYPAQGHMLTLLDLTHQIALRGLTVTIVVTPANLPSLSPLLSAHPSSVRSLVLPFPPHPEIPAGVENLRQLGNRGNIPTINALRSLADPIAAWLQCYPEDEPRPSAVVFDIFLGWAAADLGARLGLRAVSYSATSAFLAAIFADGWLRLRSADLLPPVVHFPALPGSPEFKYDCLPSLMRLCRVSNPETDLVTESVIAGVNYSGEDDDDHGVIGVFNTFEAMEGKYLNHLRKIAGVGRRKAIYAVGPLSPLELSTEKQLDPKLATWLDTCKDGSVLYVCFGSQKVLNAQQTEALASGLERSGTRFLWAANPGLALPNGFEDRTRARGLLVRGWAPQREILGHRAVGGFLSHCGWNSVLEALAAGVAVLCWPMEADQHVNARLLDDELGLGSRVCEGSEAVPDPDDLARAVARGMELGRADPRVKEMREWALAAAREEAGKELDEFVRFLKELSKPRL